MNGRQYNNMNNVNGSFSTLTLNSALSSFGMNSNFPTFPTNNIGNMPNSNSNNHFMNQGSSQNMNLQNITLNGHNNINNMNVNSQQKMLNMKGNMNNTTASNNNLTNNYQQNNSIGNNINTINNGMNMMNGINSIQQNNKNLKSIGGLINQPQMNQSHRPISRNQVITNRTRYWCMEVFKNVSNYETITIPNQPEPFFSNFTTLFPCDEDSLIISSPFNNNSNSFSSPQLFFTNSFLSSQKLSSMSTNGLFSSENQFVSDTQSIGMNNNMNNNNNINISNNNILNHNNNTNNNNNNNNNRLIEVSSANNLEVGSANNNNLNVNNTNNTNNSNNNINSSNSNNSARDGWKEKIKILETTAYWDISRDFTVQPNNSNFYDLPFENLSVSISEYMRSVGLTLNLPVYHVFTAIYYFHKFFTIRPPKKSINVFDIAMASLFVAGKVEETPVLLDNMLMVGKFLVCSFDKKAEGYQDQSNREKHELQREDMLRNERLVLDTLEFHLQTHHPFEGYIALLEKLEKEFENNFGSSEKDFDREKETINLEGNREDRDVEMSDKESPEKDREIRDKENGDDKLDDKLEDKLDEKMDDKMDEKDEIKMENGNNISQKNNGSNNGTPPLSIETFWEVATKGWKLLCEVWATPICLKGYKNEMSFGCLEWADEKSNNILHLNDSDFVSKILRDIDFVTDETILATVRDLIRSDELEKKMKNIISKKE